MKKFIKILTLILALILTFSTVTACQPDKKPTDGGGPNKPPVADGILVENAVSDYKIVIGKEYSQTEYFAATEMQTFIEQSTGARLPVVLDTAVAYDENTKVISIGNTSFVSEVDSNVNYSTFNEDGFFLKSKGKSLFINGACDRGTLYGVYDYLEKYVGVKFLAKDCTYVPTLNKLDFLMLDETEIPAFAIRVFLTGSIFSDSLFLARNRMHAQEHVTASEQYGGDIAMNGFCHNTITFVPTGTYYATADQKLQNKHMYNVNSAGEAVDICFTDGIAEDGGIDETLEISAFKVALETLKNKIKNEKRDDVSLYLFGMMDTTLDCQCSRCVTRAAKYGRSGNVVRFNNLLAREINKWTQEEYDGREINLLMFAYNNTDAAPLKQSNGKVDPTCVPDEHVYVRIAPINQNHYYSMKESQNTNYWNKIKDWGDLTPNICIWNYHTYYTNFAWYFPTTRAWKSDLTTYRDMGAYYVLMQSDHKNDNDWQDKIDLYIASKMLWDPDQDVAALQKDFIDHYYGEYAYIVKDVMGRLDERVHEIALTGEVVFGLYVHQVKDAKFYPISFLEGICAILDNAIETAKGTEYESRLKEVLITPLYMIVENVKSYYPDSEKVYNTVKKFVELAEEINFTFISEGGRLETLRNQYGIK